MSEDYTIESATFDDEAVDFRRPLTLEEVPLPEGGDFSLDILTPQVREAAREAAKKTKREAVMERIMLHDRMKGDPDFRKLIWEKCKRDPVYFINHFVYTFDDRDDDAGVVPFVLYDVQVDKIVRPYEQLCNTKAPDRCTIGIAKSRAIGYTWVSLALRMWRFLFHDNWSILIGGESRDDVDDGGQGASQQSLFGKIRFMLNELPEFAIEDLLGPSWRKSTGSLNEEYNRRYVLKNPLKPRNVIHGKQLSGMFGRGRRYSEIWADEVAHCEEMENAETSLKQTSNRFTFGSTPKGKGNFFYQAMHGALKFIRIYIWWAEMPYLDLDWYNAQREQMTDADVAQELDISFERSIGGRVLHEVVLEKWFLPQVRFDENLPLTVILDPGWSDHFAAVWAQWDMTNGQGRVIDSLCTNRKTVDWIVPFILGRIPEVTYRGDPWPHRYNDIEEKLIERHARWLEAGGGIELMEVFGDAAGGAKNIVSGSSAWDELEQYGIYVHGVKIRDDKEALRKLNLMMRHIRFADYLLHQRNGPKEQSASMGDVATQWRYPHRPRATTADNAKPIHDIYSHPGDCLKMWAHELELPDASQMPVQAGKVMRRQHSGTTEPDSTQSKGVWRQ